MDCVELAKQTAHTWPHHCNRLGRVVLAKRYFKPLMLIASEYVIKYLRTFRFLRVDSRILLFQYFDDHSRMHHETAPQIGAVLAVRWPLDDFPMHSEPKIVQFMTTTALLNQNHTEAPYVQPQMSAKTTA